MSNELTELELPYKELSIKDKDDERSLVNIATSIVGNAITAIPDDIFLLGEEQLRKSANVQLSEERLRVAFWVEYERAQKTNSKMNMNNVYMGIVTKKYFYTYIVGNSLKLAFMCTPPIEAQIALEELLLFGIEQMRSIMALPHINEKGQVDSKLVHVKQRLFEDIANRRRGQVIQRVEVKSKSMNYNVTETRDTKALSMEEIESELKELEGGKKV